MGLEAQRAQREAAKKRNQATNAAQRVTAAEKALAAAQAEAAPPAVKKVAVWGGKNSKTPSFADMLTGKGSVSAEQQAAKDAQVAQRKKKLAQARRDAERHKV